MAKVSCAWRTGSALECGDDERAGIENGDEGGEPALIVVLRAVVAENRVGHVRFEQFGGPALPLFEQLGEVAVAAFVAVAAEQFRRGGR